MIEGMLAILPAVSFLTAPVGVLWVPLFFMVFGLVLVIPGMLISYKTDTDSDAGFVLSFIGICFLFVGVITMAVLLPFVDDVPEPEVIVMEDGVVVHGPDVDDVLVEPEPEVIYEGGGITITREAER